VSNKDVIRRRRTSSLNKDEVSWRSGIAHSVELLTVCWSRNIVWLNRGWGCGVL